MSTVVDMSVLRVKPPVTIIFVFYFFIRILHISFHMVKIKLEINQQELKNS